VLFVSFTVHHASNDVFSTWRSQAKVVPHFLSDAEMEHMLAVAEPLWEPSFVQVGENKKPQVSRDRSSFSCTFQPAQDSLVKP